MDVLTLIESAVEMAESWESQAEAVEGLHPDSDAARVLRQNASSLRRWAGESTPDEVPLTVVRDRTGWSDSWLLDRVQGLAREGKARKRGRVWWVDREAALSIPRKRGHRPHLEGVQDLDQMADRILDMQTA